MKKLALAKRSQAIQSVNPFDFKFTYKRNKNNNNNNNNNYYQNQPMKQPPKQPTNQTIKKTIQSRYVFLGLYQGNFAHTESFAWPQLLMAERGAWNESSTNAGQGKAFVCVRPHTVDAHCYLWQEHPNSIRNAFYFS